MRYFCLLIAFLFLLVACKESMEENIATMLGKEVRIDEADFHIVKGRRNYYPDDVKYRLVVYLDSAECLSCATGRLHQWDDLILANLNQKVGFEFIYSPRACDWKMTRNSVASSRFIRDVYIDTVGGFKKRHPWIPEARECHTFLIDRNNKVVMVGDPRRSKGLMKLFKGIVADSISADV